MRYVRRRGRSSRHLGCRFIHRASIGARTFVHQIEIQELEAFHPVRVLLSHTTSRSETRMTDRTSLGIEARFRVLTTNSTPFDSSKVRVASGMSTSTHSKVSSVTEASDRGHFVPFVACFSSFCTVMVELLCDFTGPCRLAESRSSKTLTSIPSVIRQTGWIKGAPLLDTFD